MKIEINSTAGHTNILLDGKPMNFCRAVSVTINAKDRFPRVVLELTATELVISGDDAAVEKLVICPSCKEQVR